MEARYKTYSSGREVKLCIGNNNTCPKEAKAKTGGKCKGCSNNTDRTGFLNRHEGEVFEANGIRYKNVGNQSRKLCTGDNNTCMSLGQGGSKPCVGHQKKSKKYGKAGCVKGDIVIRNGEERKFNGIQFCKMCEHPNCDVVVTKGGKCKKHSPHWHCKFTGSDCTSIRVDGTDYCATHRGNVQNVKERSKGEAAIAEWLNAKNIKFLSNTMIISEGKVLYPDFILTDLNVIIEYDGKQHFESVEYWGGRDGLDSRILNDATKDQWALSSGYTLFRISFNDIWYMNEYLEMFMELLPLLEKNTIVSTGYAGYAHRGYVII